MERLRVMQTLTDRNEQIDWCVLGEPSSQTELGDTIRIGRRGSLSGILTVEGIQGHVAYPDSLRQPDPTLRADPGGSSRNQLG